MRRKQGEHHDLYCQNKREAGTHIYPLDAAAAKTGAALLMPGFAVRHNHQCN
nr:hypothetical protein [Geotalea uraniireducens]